MARVRWGFPAHESDTGARDALEVGLHERLADILSLRAACCHAARAHPVRSWRKHDSTHERQSR
jgi:hypothetical protein